MGAHYYKTKLFPDYAPVKAVLEKLAAHYGDRYMRATPDEIHYGGFKGKGKFPHVAVGADLALVGSGVTFSMKTVPDARAAIRNVFQSVMNLLPSFIQRRDSLGLFCYFAVCSKRQEGCFFNTSAWVNIGKDNKMLTGTFKSQRSNDGLTDSEYLSTLNSWLPEGEITTTFSCDDLSDILKALLERIGCISGPDVRHYWYWTLGVGELGDEEDHSEGVLAMFRELQTVTVEYTGYDVMLRYKILGAEALESLRTLTGKKGAMDYVDGTLMSADEDWFTEVRVSAKKDGYQLEFAIRDENVRRLVKEISKVGGENLVADT